MPRLFFGLELPDSIRSYLCGAAAPFATYGKLHRADMLHLTLASLGQVDEKRMINLALCMSEVSGAPFDLALSDFGTFKDGSILWVGVERSEPLLVLRARLARALAAESFTLAEGFAPHITLGRGMRSLPHSLPALEKRCFCVERFTLFESARVEGVLQYTPLQRRALEERL